MVTVYPPVIYCSAQNPLNKISSNCHPLLPLVSNSQLHHPHTTPCRESENSCWVSYGLLTLKIQVWYVSTNQQLQLSQRASGIFQLHCDTHKKVIPLYVQLSSADSPLLNRVQTSYLKICAFPTKDEKIIIQLGSCLFLSEQRVCQLGYCHLLTVFRSQGIFTKLSFLISQIQNKWCLQETWENLAGSFERKHFKSALWRTQCFVRFHASFLQNILLSE